MRISTPELNVVRFANEDVIATSLYIIADGNAYSGYSMFSGTMAPTGESGTWIVTKNGGSWEIDEATIENEKIGAYGDEWTMTYDVYQTEENGPYYTKGASYYDLYGNQ